MTTFFGKAQPFPDIPDDKRIQTAVFFESCRQSISMFDMFGTVFKPLKSDMINNVEELARKYKTNPAKYTTLNDLLPQDEYTVIDIGLSALWLKRALEFMTLFLREVIISYRSGTLNRSLVTLANKAYELSLKPYHGWIAQSAFAVVAKFTPYSDVLIKRMAFNQENMQDQVIDDMDIYEKGLRANVHVFDELIKSLGFENDDKV